VCRDSAYRAVSGAAKADSFRTLLGETFRAVIHNLLKLWPCGGAGPFGGGTKSCMTLSQNGSRSVLSLGRSIIVYKSTRTYGCTCYQNGVKPRTIFTPPAACRRSAQTKRTTYRQENCAFPELVLHQKKTARACNLER
jgi:hypothetical protein